MRQNMHDCITEECRRPQGDHEEVEVLVVATYLTVLLQQWKHQHTNQRQQTQHRHHQGTVPKCYTHTTPQTEHYVMPKDPY